MYCTWTCLQGATLLRSINQLLQHSHNLPKCLPLHSLLHFELDQACQYQSIDTSDWNVEGKYLLTNVARPRHHRSTLNVFEVKQTRTNSTSFQSVPWSGYSTLTFVVLLRIASATFAAGCGSHGRSCITWVYLLQLIKICPLPIL